MVCASEIPECLQILPSLIPASNVSAVFSSEPGFSRLFLTRFWTPPPLETPSPAWARYYVRLKIVWWVSHLLSEVITCRLGCLHKRVVSILHSLSRVLAPGWRSLQRCLEVCDERNDVVVGATQAWHCWVPWNNHLRLWLGWIYKWQVQILQTFFKHDILRPWLARLYILWPHHDIFIMQVI